VSQDNKKIDWSEERWKDMLVYQRKFLWLEDTLDKLAVWLGFEPGMIVIDVGCGLGNLGYTYWPYYGEGGRYIGVDMSSELIRDASKAAIDWAKIGQGSFIVGDAYKLPFPDDYADRAMCQTLLMHLEKPELALAEMVRVTKPGGLVMCAEPDNLSSTLVKHYSSIPELDLEEELLCHKVALIGNQGRIKLGRGDESIGCKIPMMMSQLGLKEIDARLNDRVYHLEPPYEGPVQRHLLESVKKQCSLDDEKEHEFFLERGKEEFQAGGGDPEEFDRIRIIDDRIRLMHKQQINQGEFFACGGSQFYIIKGRKRLT
jgi:SAM-dependent methyltransferase